ncbi:MAG: ATP-binding cassette domain-containing protein, partial [Burkholderiales bacterium]|nr:ATP-binding cassette domain-containing protein [Burkholderiales bacterium]
MIKFNHVNKWYGPNHHVLKDINLEVKQGEVVVVCGPSGSGKSTMIRTINQLEPVNDGEIWIGNVEVTSPKTDINKLRAEVGFVFQHF